MESQCAVDPLERVENALVQDGTRFTAAAAAPAPAVLLLFPLATSESKARAIHRSRSCGAKYAVMQAPNLSP